MSESAGITASHSSNHQNRSGGVLVASEGITMTKLADFLQATQEHKI